MYLVKTPNIPIACLHLLQLPTQIRKLNISQIQSLLPAEFAGLRTHGTSFYPDSLQAIELNPLLYLDEGEGPFHFLNDILLSVVASSLCLNCPLQKKHCNPFLCNISFDIFPFIVPMLKYPASSYIPTVEFTNEN